MTWEIIDLSLAKISFFADSRLRYTANITQEGGTKQPFRCLLWFSGLVIDVDGLQETTFVHSQQIDTLQNANVQLDQRVTALENGSLPSNTTGRKIQT